MTGCGRGIVAGCQIRPRADGVPFEVTGFAPAASARDDGFHVGGESLGITGPLNPFSPVSDFLPEEAFAVVEHLELGELVAFHASLLAGWCCMRSSAARIMSHRERRRR